MQARRYVRLKALCWRRREWETEATPRHPKTEKPLPFPEMERRSVIPRNGFVARLHLHEIPGPRDERGSNANRLSAFGNDGVLLNERERGSEGGRPARSVNKAGAGCGRLRRPPAQPASLHLGPGSEYATGSVGGIWGPGGLGRFGNRPGVMRNAVNDHQTDYEDDHKPIAW